MEYLPKSYENIYIGESRHRIGLKDPIIEPLVEKTWIYQKHKI
jgi:hypothetical protein